PAWPGRVGCGLGLRGAYLGPENGRSGVCGHGSLAPAVLTSCWAIQRKASRHRGFPTGDVGPDYKRRPAPTAQRFRFAQENLGELMGFHDVLLLVAVILVVLIVVGGFVMWSVLRAFRFSELSRDMDYVKTLMRNHISKQEEQEEIQRKAIKSIEDGIKGV